MNRKILLFWSLYLALCGGAESQNLAANRYVPAPKADTVFVYDTVFITDIVQVRKPAQYVSLVEKLPARQILLRETNAVGQKFLIIAPGFAATFSTDSIISSEDMVHLNNSEKMKKIGFLGVVLFAFQNMVLAQHNIGFNMGTGLHYLNIKPSYLPHTKIAPEFWAGVSYSRNFAKDKLSWNVDLNYHFLFHSDLKFIPYSEPIGLPNPRPSERYFTLPYSLFNLPISLQWNTKWISPVIGLEGYHKQSPKFEYLTTNSTTGQAVTSTSHNSYDGLSWFIGAQVPFSSRLSMKGNYFRGITEEYKGTSFNTKMERWEISLRYRLK